MARNVGLTCSGAIILQSPAGKMCMNRPAFLAVARAGAGGGLSLGSFRFVPTILQVEKPNIMGILEDWGEAVP